MNKQQLIDQIKNRFSVNAKTDVAPVVSYKGKLYTMCLYDLREDFRNLKDEYTVDQLIPFLKGEEVQEVKAIDPKDSRFQSFTFRSDTQIFNLLTILRNEQPKMGLETYTLGELEATGTIYAPAELSLIQVKEILIGINEAHNLYNEIFCQTIDYPIFEGLRDRYAPMPSEEFLRSL
jgi:hypothetical protein